jgi:hypothetical protein
LLLRRVVVARRRGLDDAARTMVVARSKMLFAIRGAPRRVTAKRHALVAAAVHYAIVSHVTRRPVAQRPLGNDARGMMLGRALDQLDVVRFLRGGFLRHVHRAAAEHCAARCRCHQLHHCRANRHCLRSSVSAGWIKQRELPMPFLSPCWLQKRR